jgi:hypothetical protein
MVPARTVTGHRPHLAEIGWMRRSRCAAPALQSLHRAKRRKKTRGTTQTATTKIDSERAQVALAPVPEGPSRAQGLRAVSRNSLARAKVAPPISALKRLVRVSPTPLTPKHNEIVDRQLAKISPSPGCPPATLLRYKQNEIAGPR